MDHEGKGLPFPVFQAAQAKHRLLPVSPAHQLKAANGFHHHHRSRLHQSDGPFHGLFPLGFFSALGHHGKRRPAGSAADGLPMAAAVLQILILPLALWAQGK